MIDWLVVTAEHPKAGRGMRGHALIWFLRTYFGRRAVAAASPATLRKHSLTARTVLVGMPSSLTTDEIRRLVPDAPDRRIVVFDYLDQHPLAWTAEQEAVLRELTDCYLKPWFDPAWNFNLRMGMLPLRRYGRFTAALLLERARRKLRSPRPTKHDVAFLGRPNQTDIFVDGAVLTINQRFHWIAELKRGARDLRFFGGFVEDSPEARQEFELEHGDASDLWHAARNLTPLRYFRTLCESRVLLAPGGNVPWTYRHYESLYAGAVVVTNDFRQRDLLVPLPRENMVHVPDGAPVLPAVYEALELSRRRPDIADENFSHLERYWRCGANSSARPALLQRFEAQLG